MSVTIYMAMSVNGYICDADGATPWSDDAWERYARAVAQVRCLVVGRTTHELMTKTDEYERIGNPRVVILTTSDMGPLPKKFSTATSPHNAVEFLLSEGYGEIMVGGGTKVNMAFLNAGLATHLMLDIEPHLFAGGIALTAGLRKNMELQLIEAEKTGDNLISVHYKISYD